MTDKTQAAYKVAQIADTLAWRNYTIEELGQWISLLSKRASHRTPLEKARKDVRDAKNYAAMLVAKLDEEWAGMEGQNTGEACCSAQETS